VADVRAMVEAVRVGALEAAERADAKAAEAMAVVMVENPNIRSLTCYGYACSGRAPWHLSAAVGIA
jgi:hypothetical protein